MTAGDTSLDGFRTGFKQVAMRQGQLAGDEPPLRAPLHYRIRNLTRPGVLRGRTSAVGEIDALNLAPESLLVIEYLSPTTLGSGDDDV